MQIDVMKIRQYAEAYGVAVRAGVLTPNRDDEAHLRKLFNLPKMNNAVIAAWDEERGVRKPITIAKEEEAATEQQSTDGNLYVEEQNSSTNIVFNKIKNKIDEDDPRLSQSDYERFDFSYAKDLKENHPQIWKAGGNIRGNEAFEYWSKYVDGDRGDGVLDWVREREAWSARHYKDGGQFKGGDTEPNLSNIGGVVAQIKWGMVGTLGKRGMKSVIQKVKDKQ